eukprot:Transcript_29528.p3 GENE.Transcript_29528~~Transcript_29528.p3  ORF type:complete len:202 (+),score=99.50 Transcript_29528:2060-2665(+)
MFHSFCASGVVISLVRSTTVLSIISPEKSAASTRLSSCSRCSSCSSRELTASTSTSTSTKPASAPTSTSAAAPHTPPAGAWRDQAASAAPADGVWGAAAEVDVGADAGFVEVEVDVEAVSSRDEQELQREQLLSLVDAALFSGEMMLNTVVDRTKEITTPEAQKEWNILKSFDDEAREAEQRAAQIEGEVLDTLNKIVQRK